MSTRTLGSDYLPYHAGYARQISRTQWLGSGYNIRPHPAYTGIGLRWPKLGLLTALESATFMWQEHHGGFGSKMERFNCMYGLESSRRRYIRATVMQAGVSTHFPHASGYLRHILAADFNGDCRVRCSCVSHCPRSSTTLWRTHAGYCMHPSYAIFIVHRVWAISGSSLRPGLESVVSTGCLHTVHTVCSLRGLACYWCTR